MKMKRVVVAGVAVLSILAAGWVSWACSSQSGPARVETVTVALPALEQNALLYVAESQKMFSRNGLHVTLKGFDTGASSINAMLTGEADIAETAEFPLVRAAFRAEPLRIIASNDRFENDYIVARKDNGVQSIADLKGKRIGVALGTIAEFYLGRFLDLHSLKAQDVTLVDISPAQFVRAIASGQVDAIVAWQPYVSQAQKQLAAPVVWPAQSGQAAYGVLVARSGWVTQHPDTVKRFLRSLKEAEDYIVRQPEEAQVIVQEWLNYSDHKYVDSVWPLHQFSLSLDQTLVIAMKDEAQWMIVNNLTDKKSLPDFTSYIYEDSLKAIKPEAVNIIR